MSFRELAVCLRGWECTNDEPRHRSLRGRCMSQILYYFILYQELVLTKPISSYLGASTWPGASIVVLLCATAEKSMSFARSRRPPVGGLYTSWLCKNISPQKFTARHGIALASRLMLGTRCKCLPSARSLGPVVLQVLDLGLNSPPAPHCPAFNHI